MCFNRNVIAGLAVTAIGIFVVAPNLVGSALPLLLVAACPLSMLFMGKMMGGRDAAPAAIESRSDQPLRSSAEARIDRNEQVAQVQAELQRLERQRADLTRQLARIEASPPRALAHQTLPEPGGGASRTTSSS